MDYFYLTTSSNLLSRYHLTGVLVTTVGICSLVISVSLVLMVRVDLSTFSMVTIGDLLYPLSLIFLLVHLGNLFGVSLLSVLDTG